MAASNLTTHELDASPWLRVESTLMATARLVREVFDARLAALGLNLTQASLLGYVAEFGATTQTRLADRLGIGRAAIGSIVDRLERDGHVARGPDPDDRRVWIVDITPSGRALVDQVRAVDEVLRAELRRGIGREERQALAWVMTRLQHNLRAALDAHPDITRPPTTDSPTTDSPTTEPPNTEPPNTEPPNTEQRSTP
jgi:DNA-binding MarR family transcriptional regulator